MPHFVKEGWITGFLYRVLPPDSDKFIELTLAVHLLHVFLNCGILFHLRIVCVILKVPEAVGISADS